MPETPCLLNEKRQNYFAREVSILKICGISLGEQENVVYKIYSFIVRYFIIIAYPFVCLGDINKHGFNGNAQITIYVFATSIASVGSVTAHRHRVKLGKLLNRIEEEPFLPILKKGDDKEDTLVSEWALAKKRQGLTLYVALATWTSFGVLYTIVKLIKSNDSSEWIDTFAYGPITVLDVTRSPNYEITWLYQNFAILFLCFTLSTIIIVLSGILAYICTQFQILQNKLRKITEQYPIKVTNQSSDKNNPSEIPWKYLKIALKDVVSYHVNILEIIAEVDDIFSIFMLYLFFIIVCTLCFMIYATSVLPVSDPRIILLGLESVISAFLPLMVCYWGEQVTYESAQVGRAAYEANFVGIDLRFQKALNIIVIRSQKSARIKAGKLVDTSMATFAWIVRSSISYFMIARNLKMGDQ